MSFLRWNFFHNPTSKETPLRPLENAVTTADQATPDTSPFVETTIRGLMLASYSTVITYGWFSYQKTVQGITQITLQAGLTSPNLRPVIIASGAILTMLDAVANVSFVDYKTAAANWAKSLPKGFIHGAISHAKNSVSSVKNFACIFVPSMAMLYTFPVSSWVNAIPLQGLLNDYLGAWCLIPMVSVALLGSSYMFITQAADNLNGVKFYTNEGDQQLLPRQAFLFEHLLFSNWRWKASAIQCAIDTVPSCFNRSLGISWAASQMIQWFIEFKNELIKNDHPEEDHQIALRCVEVSTFFISLLSFYFARAPLAYKKYFGDKLHPFYLVTDEQRDLIYQRHYANMDWLTFLKVECKRFLSLPAIAETIVAGFFTGYFTNIMMLGLLASLFTYFGIYRCADLTLALNKIALQDPEILAAIIEILRQHNPDFIPPENTIERNNNIHPYAEILATFISTGSWTTRSLIAVPINDDMLSKYFTFNELVRLLLALSLGVLTALNGFQYFVFKITKTMNIWLPNPTPATLLAEETPSSTEIEETVTSPHATIEVPTTDTNPTSTDETTQISSTFFQPKPNKPTETKPKCRPQCGIQ